MKIIPHENSCCVVGFANALYLLDFYL